MPRYIDADKLIPIYEEMIRSGDYCKDCMKDAIFEIEQAPTISPDDVRGKGKWIERADDWYGDYAECSNCHDEYTIPDGGLCFKFCPNCGAKMEVSEDA